MMKNRSQDSVRKLLFPVIPSVCVFLFFLIWEPSHIRFQEQYQSFLFTSDYLREVLSFPGSPAVYIGRFLTQFFISPVAGALVLGLLFPAIHRLTCLIMGGRDDYGSVLSLVPPALFALYMCDENAFLSAGVAMLIGLASAYPLHFITGKGMRTAAAIFGAVAVYFLAGNIGTVVYAAAACAVCRDFRIGAGIIAAGVICTYISRYLSDYPFIRLLTGPHYHRYHDTVPVLPWAAAFSVWIPACLKVRTVRKPGGIRLWTAYCLVTGGMVAGLFLCRDGQKEEMMTYISMMQREDWEGIMKTASKREPVDPISLSCVNLALAESGYMGEWMFRFRQVGREGLFYPYRREHISPIPSSMVYWNLGLINTCQRFTFAAQEVIPDYQKSSWCRKRLAEIYLVNGDYLLARKCLEPLKYTLFYRSWALRTEKLLDDPSSIDSHEKYGAVRKLMLKDHRCTYVATGLDEPLYDLCAENPGNTLAYQYLLALDLLEKDLDGFAEHFDASGFRTVPSAYQEAYVLYWSQDHSGPEGMPSFVSEKIIDRFMRFSDDINSGDEKYLRSRYSDTYWFYYFFREQK